jgi:hypothetical protein
MRPCPRCATPAVIAANDQFMAALNRLHPSDRDDIHRAAFRLLHLVTHHNQPKENP